MQKKRKKIKISGKKLEPEINFTKIN